MKVDHIKAGDPNSETAIVKIYGHPVPEGRLVVSITEAHASMSGVGGLVRGLLCMKREDGTLCAVIGENEQPIEVACEPTDVEIEIPDHENPA